LLFEREVVAKALDNISGSKGMEFLEKIIQVAYHIPHASPAAVQKVLFDGLDKHVKETPASRHWVSVMLTPSLDFESSIDPAAIARFGSSA
jgi:hypothetical protein